MSKTSRRNFAKSLAAAGAIAPLAVSDLLAQTAPVTPPPTTIKVAPPPPADTKVPSDLGKALTGVIRASYGEHLSAEELTKLDADFQDYAPFVERFRKYALTNADEPDFTFASLVERW